MEYETDNVDYPVAEFYEIFKHRLQKVAKITQGFHGDIIDDVFDMNWVFRIHTTSGQKRVVARTRDHVYSVPLNYPYKMRVIKKSGKVGKEQTIKQVLQDYMLLVNVRFSSDQHLIVVGVKKITDHFPVLTLVEQFDEIYMLANSLINERIYLSVVPIPLYLSKLRLAEVTGIKGQPAEVWTYFKNEMSTIISETVEFDTTYGNKDIAIFNEIPLETEGSYSYLQPRKYTPLYDILNFESDDSSGRKGRCLDHVYDQFSGQNCSDNDSRRKGDVKRKLLTTTQRNRPLPPLPKNTNITSTEKESMAIVKKTPPLPSKPYIKIGKSGAEQESQKGLSDLNSERLEILILKDERGLGIILAGGKNTEQEFLQIKSIIPGGAADQNGRLKTGDILVRVNDKFVLGYSLLEAASLIEAFEPGEPVELEVYRGITLITDPCDLNMQKVTEEANGKQDFDCQRSSGQSDPTTKARSRTASVTTNQGTRTDKQTIACNSSKKEENSINNKNNVTTKVDIRSLSIQELGCYLKELRLSKYIPMFENERIDGFILLDLDVDIYMNEFGLSKIEACRLWKFAQDGHVPR